MGGYSIGMKDIPGYIFVGILAVAALLLVLCRSLLFSSSQQSYGEIHAVTELRAGEKRLGQNERFAHATISVSSTHHDPLKRAKTGDVRSINELCDSWVNGSHVPKKGFFGSLFLVQHCSHKI
jgi:hypothetical protein